MDRNRVITVIMVMVALGASLLLIYRSVRMHTGDAAVKDDKAISTSDLPGAAEAVEADRNEEDDPVFRISAEELVGRWNMTCDAAGSRSHFCIIPVDDQVMKQFEDGGAKIVRF